MIELGDALCIAKSAKKLSSLYLRSALWLLLFTDTGQEEGDDGDVSGDKTSTSVTDHDTVEERYVSRAPITTVIEGRGPSQVADFFSARGAPTILEASLDAECDAQLVASTHFSGFLRSVVMSIYLISMSYCGDAHGIFNGSDIITPFQFTPVLFSNVRRWANLSIFPIGFQRRVQLT